jgi:hypothetical protein
MKTLLLWTAKGCRKPKVQGTATAAGSAATIHTMRRSATDGRGRLWIVDAATAAEARELIARHKAGEDGVAAMSAVVDDGRTVALGTQAVLAIGGANESLRHWDARLARQGRVTVEQTRALTGDLEADMLRGLFGGAEGILREVQA